MKQWKWLVAFMATAVLGLGLATQESDAKGGSSSSSGGRSSSPSFSRPSTPSFSRPSTSSTPSFSKPSTSSSPSSSSTKPSTSSSTGSRPSSSSFDSKPAAAAAKAESRASMTRAEAPKSTYTSPAGKPVTIDPKDTKVTSLRTQTNHDQWVNRSTRQETVYHVYHSRPPIVYHDPYNPFFMYLLLDRSLEDRARWAYHHRESMDKARYDALLAKDARLEARIKQMEAEKVAKDPNFTLPGVDPDLQYDDGYVDAVVNADDGSGFWWWFWFIVIFLGFIGFLFLAANQ